jgi:hypothetical protein
LSVHTGLPQRQRRRRRYGGDALRTEYCHTLTVVIVMVVVHEQMMTINVNNKQDCRQEHTKFHQWLHIVIVSSVSQTYCVVQGSNHIL